MEIKWIFLIVSIATLAGFISKLVKEGFSGAFDSNGFLLIFSIIFFIIFFIIEIGEN
jgi:hypothetical protein